ncbi:hypothetical protein SASPL_143848 [Salvia splendens]|uniref:Uncharacterized protein n=1 Tax=Salvia splendens TaxID=180675 RepID=A0A8X8ZAP9_SALSN|nr:hypothetical protein SASPL_143848 [Salvia splendens]
MSEIVAESGEASDWTANWNGDDAPLAGGRKQSRNSKPAKATFGELFKYKSKARLEEKIVRSVTKDAQGVLSQKSGEIHEVGNHSSAKVRVCEDMIMKPMVEMQDMQEVGRPPDRGNDVLTMTSEPKLKKELDLVLQHEESLCQQKSQSDWIKLGDQNTSFFHLRMIRRRKSNIIELLKNGDGEWVKDRVRLQTLAVRSYMKKISFIGLYTRNVIVSQLLTIADEIRVQFSSKEVSRMLFLP